MRNSRFDARDSHQASDGTCADSNIYDDSEIYYDDFNLFYDFKFFYEFNLLSTTATTAYAGTVIRSALNGTSLAHF